MNETGGLLLLKRTKLERDFSNAGTTNPESKSKLPGMPEGVPWQFRISGEFQPVMMKPSLDELKSIESSTFEVWNNPISLSDPMGNFSDRSQDPNHSSSQINSEFWSVLSRMRQRTTSSSESEG